MKVKEIIESSAALVNIIVQEKLDNGEVISTPELSTYSIRELSRDDIRPSDLLEIHKDWLNYDVKLINATTVICADEDTQMYYDEPVVLLIIDL